MELVEEVKELLLETGKDRFPTIETLVINLDNGPENHIHR